MGDGAREDKLALGTGSAAGMSVRNLVSNPRSMKLRAWREKQRRQRKQRTQKHFFGYAMLTTKSVESRKTLWKATNHTILMLCFGIDNAAVTIRPCLGAPTIRF
jgi:hypothetical protein